MAIQGHNVRKKPKREGREGKGRRGVEKGRRGRGIEEEGKRH